MPPPPLAEPAALSLLNEVTSRLNNPAERLDPFTLRRYERQLKAELRTAPVELWGPIHAALGTIFHSMGDNRDALDAFRNAVRFQPDVADHENNLAAILFVLRDYQEGLRHLARAQELVTNNAEMLATLLCLEAKGRQALHDEGAERFAFERAVSVAPAEGNPQLRLALNAADLGYENDAAEFLARFLASEARYQRPDDEPAVAVIERHRSEAGRILQLWPGLRRSVNLVIECWTSPVPSEHEIGAHVELPPSAWAKLRSLAQLGPDEA